MLQTCARSALVTAVPVSVVLLRSITRLVGV